MISGHATVADTTALSEKNGDLTYLPLGSTDLQVSQAGFGCYRVGLGEKEHERALFKALCSGVNLIDTSSNYADGLSEQLVGAVLKRYIAEGRGSRSQVVLVSKVGYLQGQNYSLSQKRKSLGRAFHDLVLYDEGLEHCIHPEFLEDQLERSLERLQVQTLDAYLLHNPEYYLNWAAEQEMPREEAEHEFYRRIEAAFRYLETQVQGGRIGCYGISSNTFPHAPDDRGFCSLSRVLEIAKSISVDHHFRIVQFPMNLLERGAAVQVNQTDGTTLLACCRANDLGVLINRPLNAIYRGRMLRLAEADTILSSKHPQYEAMCQNALFLRQRLKAADEAWSGDEASLSQLSLRALRSSLGNSCVLVGMRRETYVDDILTELKRKTILEDKGDAWDRLNL